MNSPLLLPPLVFQPHFLPSYSLLLPTPLLPEPSHHSAITHRCLAPTPHLTHPGSWRPRLSCCHLLPREPHVTRHIHPTAGPLAILPALTFLPNKYASDSPPCLVIRESTRWQTATMSVRATSIDHPAETGTTTTSKSTSNANAMRNPAAPRPPSRRETPS